MPNPAQGFVPERSGGGSGPRGTAKCKSRVQRSSCVLPRPNAFMCASVHEAVSDT